MKPMTRLEWIEKRNPEKGAKIRAKLKKIKADREELENGILNPETGAPSMSWNKADLIEYAESMDPPIEVLASWTKQDILDAIEAAE